MRALNRGHHTHAHAHARSLARAHARTHTQTHDTCKLPGLGWPVEGALVTCGMQSEANNFVKHGHRLFPRMLIFVKVQAPATSD